MKRVPAEKLRSFLLGKAATHAKNAGEDFDFILSGMMDSLGFVDFLEELEREFQIEINFQNSDPSEFTSIAGLMKHFAEEPRA
jgi:acyl carrier protein